jgi:hypothetical protein
VKNANERVELDQLATLNRAGLTQEWRRVFGHAAPRGAQARLLKGALAWQLQVDQESEGDTRRLVRQLRNWSAHAAVSSLQPGTRLLREWKGQTHQVLVVPGGFEYEGEKYGSLTAVSRKITGMVWSGPLFFGLRK